ncbi:MAG: hypothetical protein AB1657_03500 [Candidatus Micrarchaeota archaeon]
MDEGGSSQKPGETEGLEAVVEYILDGRNADIGRFGEALEKLEGLLREGEKPGRELLNRIEIAAREGGTAVGQRAAAILKIIRAQREADEIALLRKFLHDRRVEKAQKRAMLGDGPHFASEERMDVLVEYLLTGADCDPELYVAGLETFTAMNKDGALISTRQISIIGKGLKSVDSELRGRAIGLLYIAVEHSLRAVLENPDVPEEEKLDLLSNKGYFVSRMPRSVSILVDFMLDSDAAQGRMNYAAKSTFGALMAEGLKLTEHHVSRIVGMMTVDPSMSRVGPKQRENALWMLERVVSSGMPVERKLQGWIMNAATGKWQKEGKPVPAEEEMGARKLCGLKGILLILKRWLGELESWVENPWEGKEPETKWYFRPGDKRDIEADAEHPDEEIREAAKRAGGCIRDIEQKIFEGLAKGRISIASQHIPIIVGMLCTESRGDAPKPGHRAQAWRMFKQLVSSGAEIPDEQQLEIVKAAVSRIPGKDSAGFENARLRKIYGLQATELVLACLLEKAGGGEEAGGKEWPLQARYRREIALNTCHDDAEVSGAAVRVNELILRIIGKGEAGRSSPKPAQPGMGTDADEILRAYIGGFRSGMEGNPAEASGNREGVGDGITTERVLEEAWAEAGKELANQGDRYKLARVEAVGRASTHPLVKDDFPETEITPVALNRQVLEALIDKPGIPPAVKRALRKIAERREGGPARETAGGRLWPPPNGGKKQ